MTFNSWIKKNISINDLVDAGYTDVLIVCDLRELNKIRDFNVSKARLPKNTLNYLKIEYIKANTDGSFKDLRRLGNECSLSERSIKKLWRELNKVSKPFNVS